AVVRTFVAVLGVGRPGVEDAVAAEARQRDGDEVAVIADRASRHARIVAGRLRPDARADAEPHCCLVSAARVRGDELRKREVAVVIDRSAVADTEDGRAADVVDAARAAGGERDAAWIGDVERAGLQRATRL